MSDDRRGDGSGSSGGVGSGGGSGSGPGIGGSGEGGSVVSVGMRAMCPGSRSGKRLRRTRELPAVRLTSVDQASKTPHDFSSREPGWAPSRPPPSQARLPIRLLYLDRCLRAAKLARWREDPSKGVLAVREAPRGAWSRIECLPAAWTGPYGLDPSRYAVRCPNSRSAQSGQNGRSPPHPSDHHVQCSAIVNLSSASSPHSVQPTMPRVWGWRRCAESAGYCMDPPRIIVLPYDAGSAGRTGVRPAARAPRPVAPGTGHR